MDAESRIEEARWTDVNPKWINYKKRKPEDFVEVLAYNKNWIDEDFNPTGIRIGFIDGNGDFTSAYWWDYQDCYETISKAICEENSEFYSKHIGNTEPTHWMSMPKLPTE